MLGNQMDHSLRTHPQPPKIKSDLLQEACQAFAIAT